MSVLLLKYGLPHNHNTILKELINAYRLSSDVQSVFRYPQKYQGLCITFGYLLTHFLSRSVPLCPPGPSHSFLFLLCSFIFKKLTFGRMYPVVL